MKPWTPVARTKAQLNGLTMYPIERLGNQLFTYAAVFAQARRLSVPCYVNKAFFDKVRPERSYDYNTNSTSLTAASSSRPKTLPSPCLPRVPHDPRGAAVARPDLATPAWKAALYSWNAPSPMTRGYATFNQGRLCLASSSRGAISMTAVPRFASE